MFFVVVFLVFLLPQCFPSAEASLSLGGGDPHGRSAFLKPDEDGNELDLIHSLKEGELSSKSRILTLLTPRMSF